MHEAKRAPHLVVGDLGWGRGRAGGTALLRSRMGDWQNQKSWLETPGLGWLVFQEELERVGCFITRGVDGACRPSPLLDTQLNRDAAWNCRPRHHGRDLPCRRPVRLPHVVVPKKGRCLTPTPRALVEGCVCVF